MSNWRDPQDYAIYQNSSPELIAWQFLRRNPDYQQDYSWFMSLWIQLETVYGAPPHRDFDSWKKDSRAYRSEREIYNTENNSTNTSANSNVGDCASQDDNLLIECWMGSKWGFYKFPIDPKIENPKLGTELTWRTTAATVKLIHEDSISAITLNDSKNKTAVIFDLNKDLKQQIQSAKQQLIIAQKDLANLNATKKDLILCLRILDINQQDTSNINIQRELDISFENFVALKRRSVNLMNGQYREILNSIF